MSIARVVIAVITGALMYLHAPIHGQYPPEFNELIALVPGVFDNKAQFDDDIARHLPVKQRHQRLTTSLKQENIPFLSERRNFYLEQYLNGNSSDLTRQRIYSFGIDPYSLAMNLQVYQLKNASNFIHAKTNDSAFCTVTQDDVIYAQGCDVYWYKADGKLTRFESWMKKTCYIRVNDDKVSTTSLPPPPPPHLVQTSTLMTCAFILRPRISHARFSKTNK